MYIKVIQQEWQLADFNKVGLLLINGNSFMLCRKHGLNAGLILPGGRVEQGESSLQCLERELNEELGDVQLIDAEFIGSYEDIAASDDPSERKTVRIELYSGSLIGEPGANSEIEELVWYGPASDPALMTPILKNCILPDLITRGILNWTK